MSYYGTDPARLGSPCPVCRTRVDAVLEQRGERVHPTCLDLETGRPMERAR